MSESSAVLEACPECGEHHDEQLLKCPNTDSPLPLAGRLLDGKFRFRQELGTGGMASVWLATNKNIDRPVAIKLLRSEVTKNPEAVARFLSEAKAAARIGSEHIVDVLDSGVGPLGPYIVMEAMTGQDLADVLEGEERLPPERILPIILDVLDALEAAHHAGIVHRDIKPGNIFLHYPTPGQMQVKLMDFGVSKFLDGSNDATTKDGILLGTPEYMAPEQLKGPGKMDRRADVFSIAAVVYRALTGKTVFKGNNLPAVILSMSQDVPTPVSEIEPDIPQALSDVLAKALSREPEQRHGSAHELADALRPFAGDLGTEKGPPIALPPPRDLTKPTAGVPADAPRWRAPAIAVLAVIVLGLVGMWIASGQEPEPPAKKADDAPAMQAPADGGETTGGETAETGDTTKTPGKRPGRKTTAGTGIDLPDVTDPDPLAEESDDGTDETTGLLEDVDETTGTDDTGDSTDTDDELTLEEEADGTTDDTGDIPEEIENAEDPEEKTTSRPRPKHEGPPPSGTVQSGTMIALVKRPSTTDQAGAKRYCAGLANKKHLGVEGWRLANPTQARKFIGKGVKSAKYWTTALWKGKALAFRLPAGKKSSEKASKKAARPLCVAYW